MIKEMSEGWIFYKESMALIQMLITEFRFPSRTPLLKSHPFPAKKKNQENKGPW